MTKWGIKIGYPDKWDTYLDSAQINSKADGGSYFENILEIAKSVHKVFVRIAGHNSRPNKMGDVSVHGQCLLQCNFQ